MKNKLLRLFRKLYTTKAIVNKKIVKAYLKEKTLVIADVGATGGPEPRWLEIQDFCHFLTFDPDPRAETNNTLYSNSNFPVGLWSSKTERNLHLATFPSASSVYSFNQEGLNGFLNAFCHIETSQKAIQLDTMESLVKTVTPDFIKVDAEGADLEILKGARKFLESSCLGVQVEVSFFERHEKAPFFGETDSYLRNFGYILMDLSRERWIRSNNVFALNSRPQVIWGNAVYMLSPSKFLERLSILSEEDRSIFFVKYITVLLVYHLHDYAKEICVKALEKQYISKKIAEDMQEGITKALPSDFFYCTKLILVFLIALGALICLKLISKKSLGVIEFFNARARQLASALLNLARGGPANSVVADSE